MLKLHVHQLASTLAVLFLVGCGPGSQSPGKQSGDRISTSELNALARPLVLDCLKDFFSQNTSTDVIYIETSDYVPSDLQQVGDREAVVLSREELAARYEGADRPPRMVRVDVRQSELDPADRFHIEICGPGIMVVYDYRIERGVAVLVEKSALMGE